MFVALRMFLSFILFVIFFVIFFCFAAVLLSIVGPIETSRRSTAITSAAPSEATGISASDVREDTPLKTETQTPAQSQVQLASDTPQPLVIPKSQTSKSVETGETGETGETDESASDEGSNLKTSC